MPDGRRPEPGGWNRLVLEVEDLASRVVERSGAPNVALPRRVIRRQLHFKLLLTQKQVTRGELL